MTPQFHSRRNPETLERGAQTHARTRVPEQHRSRGSAVEAVAEGPARSAVPTRPAPRGCGAEAHAHRDLDERWELDAVRQEPDAKRHLSRDSIDRRCPRMNLRDKKRTGSAGASERRSGAAPLGGTPCLFGVMIRKWAEAAAAQPCECAAGHGVVRLKTLVLRRAAPSLLS